jgi:choline dehydrogenase-like flavoprotein
VEDDVTETAAGTHVSYRERSETSFEGEVDFVVVGSGAGGATAAVVLARAGPASSWSRPARGATLTTIPTRATAPCATCSTTGAPPSPAAARCGRWCRPAHVGGSTVINSAICVRTPGDIFQQWQREHGLEDLSQALWTHQDRIEHELCVEEVPPEARGRSNLLAAAGDAAAGLDGHVMRRYVKGCVGSGQCLQGCSKLK